MDTLRQEIVGLKEATYNKMEEKLLEATMRELLAKLRKETELSKKVSSLETRMATVETSLITIL